MHLFNKLRSHLSFANVVAMIALFVALSGTSYAVSKIGPKDIRKNAVRAKHIKKSQVRSKQIKNRSVRASDLAPGVIGTTLQSSAGQARRDAGPTGVASSQNFTTVATLGGLEAGSYVLLAKTNQSAHGVHRGPLPPVGWRTTMTTPTGGCGQQGTPEAQALQLVHAFAGSGSAVLACRTPDGAWSASDSKIIAIKVASCQLERGRRASRRPRPAGLPARPKATGRHSRNTPGSRCRSP